MFVRKVRRKCGVRGCKNIDCFSISLSREAGNSVIICKSCLGKALGAIDDIDPKTKSNIPAVGRTAIPPLFFNGGAPVPSAESETPDDVTPDDVTPEDVTPESETPEDVTPESAYVPGKGVVCTTCGRTFDSDKALKAHKRYCKPEEK